MPTTPASCTSARSPAVPSGRHAGDPRPGPVHLNVPWREPLGPEPRPADVTARSKLALEGRDDRPLTTVPPAPSPPAPQLVDALAERVAASRRGLIVAGRMSPGAAREVAGLAAATGFPILAEPTSQLRYGPHDRSAVVSAYEPIARERPDELAPDLILRFGDLPTCKPLRQWLATLDDAHQVVVDPAHGWNDPSRIAGAIVRAQPGALAASLAARSTSRGPSPAGANTGSARRRSRAPRSRPSSTPSSGRPSRACSGRSAAPTPTVSSSTPRRACRSATRRPSCPAAMPTSTSSPTAAPTASMALISSGIGAAASTGRPTVIITGDLGVPARPRRARRDRRGARAGADRRHQQRRWRNLQFLPQAGEIAEAEFEALLGTPRSVDPAAAAALFGLAHRRLERLDELPEALAAGTGLIEVVTDRAANVDLHRALTAAAQEAVERALE